MASCNLPPVKDQEAQPSFNPSIAPVTEKEVASYYREDAMIWRVYLAFRKLDRFLHLRILGKPYVYILPEKIKR